jgi:hypothetical protein
MRKLVEKYVRNCHICKRFKTSRDWYFNLLNLFSISNKFWTNIIVKFVIELSLNKEFNVILMIVNRLTKMRHYISCLAKNENTSTKKITRLLINYVWKLHELLNIIISNRKSQFIFLLWKSICKVLKITFKLSIAFHSKTNKQSEIANQEMKYYLRNYCNYQQND